MKTNKKTNIMKTSKITTLLALIITAGCITLSSCRKKEREVELDSEQLTATDNNIAENAVSDLDLMGSQISENGNLTTFRTSNGGEMSGRELDLAAVCATVTGVGTQIVTVDFGTSGCVGTDGRIRTGILIYNFSASTPSTSIYYRNPGFSMTISSQNYVVDGNQVQINNKTVTNTTPNSIPTGINPGTNLTWAVSANVSIVKANGNTISWTCNRTKELTNTSDPTCYKGQGYAIDWTKAEIKINGSTNGVNAKGENFTAVAANLVRRFSCAPDPNRPKRHPFVSGTITYTPGSRPIRVVDFGNGACDLNATLTVNGNTYVISLP